MQNTSSITADLFKSLDHVVMDWEFAFLVDGIFVCETVQEERG